MTDDLIIEANGQKIQGWEHIRATRGIERVPADFEIQMTERFPGELAPMIINAGDSCKVYLGSDLVITGYVDRVISTMRGNSHEVHVTGRSKTADLVDCSAEWPGGQIQGTSALDVAQKLAKPYGINVKNLASYPGPAIPQFTLILGETAFELIERTCRYARLLAYDDTNGDLLLNQIGGTSASSGFSEGVNVEAATVVNSMDQRFSDYVAYLISIDNFNDFSQTCSIGDANQLAQVHDSGVPRYRRMVMIAEAVAGGQELVVQRAYWEAARRQGRSKIVNLRTDSWRDSSGALYTPNTLVMVDLPTLKTSETMTISSVTYLRDESGTHADLTLMSPVAFIPEPTLLYKFGLAEIMPSQLTQ